MVVRALTPVRQFIMILPSVASTRKAREHSELDQSPVLRGAEVALRRAEAFQLLPRSVL